MIFSCLNSLPKNSKKIVVENSNNIKLKKQIELKYDNIEVLMNEIKKIQKVTNPNETLLIADSMIGQESVNVAKAFQNYVDLTGIILTRVDGDSRGGAALSMTVSTGKPIKFLGVGEKISNLEKFSPERVADRILDMGDIVGITGDSGSGKSTLVTLLAGFLTPTNGKIEADKKNIQKNLYGWQKQISYIPQNIFLKEATIEENIAFGEETENIDFELLVKAAKVAHIYSFIKDTDKGFKTLVGERGILLSGGQRQRIAIARAIYKKPKLLILDEATSALDNNTEKQIIKNINEFSNDITLLMIAHRLSSLEICDHIYEIKGKKIIYKGSPKELF